MRNRTIPFNLHFNVAGGAMFLMLLLVCFQPPSTLADTIHLKSGNKISGRVISQEKINGRVHILLETEFGGVLKLDPRQGNSARY